MNKTILVGALALAAGFVVAVSAGLLRRHAEVPVPDPTAFSPGLNEICGPRSLATAISRLGKPIGLSQFDQLVTAEHKGTSFGDLAAAARANGFEAVLTRLSWNDLAASQWPAILWVNGDHFVVVDPREARGAGADSGRLLRLYDIEMPAKYWSATQLGQVWTGEALVLRPVETTRRRGKVPSLEWDRCLVDVGVVSGKQDATVRFPFRNTGHAALSVRLGKTGCSCAAAKLSREVLAPGEDGVLEMTIDLKAKRGFFQTFLLLTTNDPTVPTGVLYAQGSVMSDTLVSAEKLYLGEIPQGQTARASLQVFDSGDDRLELKDVRVELAHSDPDAAPLKPTVTKTRLTLENTRKWNEQKSSLRPGDYMLDIVLGVPIDYRPGTVRGQVVIVADQGGKRAEARVPITGEVVPHAVSLPPSLVLQAQAAGTIAAQITIRSLSGRPLQVQTVSMVGEKTIDVKRFVASATANGVTLDLELAARSEPGIPLRHGRLAVGLADGVTVHVPVVLNTAPH